MKQRRIEQRLEVLDKNLANAEVYIENGMNVLSSSWLHLQDWTGQSGHPLWMKNHMVPRTLEARAKLETTLGRLRSARR